MEVTTLDRYVIRCVLVRFAQALAVLLIVLSLERLLRLMDIAAAYEVSFFWVLKMLFYLLPHYLGLAIPASLFISVILAVRSLHENSELAVLQSSGIALRLLYKPALFLALPIVLLMLVLVSLAQPYARYAYRDEVHGIMADNPLAGLRPGEFLEIEDDAVIRAGRILSNGQLVLEDVFIFNKSDGSGTDIAISAPSAVLGANANTGAPMLTLYDGNMVRDNREKNRVSKLAFESYPWLLPGPIDEPYGPRGQDQREMNLSELLRGGVAEVLSETTRPQQMAEFHARLVKVCTSLFLILWAVPLALVGSGRTGRAVGVVLGVALFVLYEKVLGVGEAFAAGGVVSPWASLWGPSIFFVVCGGGLAIRMLPERIRTGTVTSWMS